MIYIKVTPNRPDALGVLGIARDLAAKGLGKLKPLEVRRSSRDASARRSACRLLFAGGDNTPCPAVHRPLFPRA